MHQALLASHNQCVYTFGFEGRNEVANWVRERDIEALTSSCGRFDFWTSPLLRCGRLQPINRPAIRMLMGVTGFTGADVPILRGAIVITSHDAAGEITGLTPEHIDQLVDMGCRLNRRRDEWALDLRCGRLARAELRRARHDLRMRRQSFPGRNAV